MLLTSCGARALPITPAERRLRPRVAVLPGSPRVESWSWMSGSASRLHMPQSNDPPCTGLCQVAAPAGHSGLSQHPHTAC